jgi:hypothetical protein
VNTSRLQWPRGLRHELSSPAPTLKSNPTVVIDICVRLLGIGSGLATG